MLAVAYRYREQARAARRGFAFKESDFRHGAFFLRMYAQNLTSPQRARVDTRYMQRLRLHRGQLNQMRTLAFLVLAFVCVSYGKLPSSLFSTAPLTDA